MKPRRPSRPYRAASHLLAAGLLAASAIAGAANAPAETPASPPLTESMEVVLVNVEVWVYDKQDIPIRGLTAGDFEVLEDGVAVPITHFAEIQERPAIAPRPVPILPSGPSAPAAASPPATEEPPSLVVYFDQLHLTPPGTKRLVRDLKGFLTSGTTPPERILILRQTYDLFTEAGFGSDRKQISDALARIGESAAMSQVDARFSLGRLQQSWDLYRDYPNPCHAFAVAAKGEIESYIALAQRSSAATLENLQRTARMLATLPGPKTLLFVSESMETRAGAELIRFATNVCGGEKELSDLSNIGDAAQVTRELQAFADDANRNRITVYPFQATGLQAPVTMGAEQQGFEPHNANGVDGLLRAGKREGLLELARQTGGWAVLDRNRFGEELDRLGTDMTTYYSLAYSPRRPGGTANHKIDVRAKGTLAKYARLRHRLSYRDKEPADVLQDRLEGAVAFGAQRNPLGVRIAAGVLGEASEGRYGMPLHVLVPAAGIAFLPQGSADQASIKVSILATNPKSRQRVKLEESFRPVRPPANAQLLDLRMVLELSQGVHVVAVAVRDEVTGESSVVATTLAIHDPAATPGRSRR
jgi:VWFA-related protein